MWSKLDPEGIEVYETLTDTLLNTIYIEQQDSTTNCLLLLDDCGHDLHQLDQKLLNKLIANSRHLGGSQMTPKGLSIICLHQKLTQSPTIMRANTDTIISFAASSFLEREALWKEVSTVPRREFLDIFNSATKDPHSYLVSTIDKGGRIRFYGTDLENKIH